MPAGTVFTVGHSTRSVGDLVTVLRAAEVAQLIDVRRFPASRRHPHFNRDALQAALPGRGIAYDWLGGELGGRVKPSVPVEQSRNAAWQVPAFRAYADAMPSATFQSGLAELERLAAARPAAFMCAERLWWSCHRRLIADALTVRGWQVVHLIDVGQRQPHALTEFARVVDGALSYPALL
jgi:uncharacterized protein (DUF488 family)